VDWKFADNIIKGDVSPEELRLEAYVCDPANFEEYVSIMEFDLFSEETGPCACGQSFHNN
jgi:hypothetical protein